jgi:hypothetical protein
MCYAHRPKHVPWFYNQDKRVQICKCEIKGHLAHVVSSRRTSVIEKCPTKSKNPMNAAHTTLLFFLNRGAMTGRFATCRSLAGEHKKENDAEDKHRDDGT